MNQHKIERQSYLIGEDVKMNQPRTIQEFVEDLVSNGINLKQILIVAAQTRWKNSKSEIKKEYSRLTNWK